MKSLVVIFTIALSIACSFGQSTGPLLIQTGTGAGRIANPLFVPANSGTTSTTFAAGNDSRITASAAVVARLLGTGTLTANTSGTLGTGAFGAAAVSGTNITVSSGSVSISSSALNSIASGTTPATVQSGTISATSTAAIDLTNSTSSAPLIIPSGTSIQSLFFGTIANGTSIGSETVQWKLRLTSKKRIDLLPSQDGQGDGFIQLGNHGPSHEFTFIGPDGDATASYPSTYTHPLLFESNYWNGSAPITKYSGIQGYTGTDGLPMLILYASATQTGGTQGLPSQATGSVQTLKIQTTALTSAVPILVPTSGTSGIGGFQLGASGWGMTRFGSDVEIYRNGTRVAFFESSDTVIAGPVYSTFFGAQNAGSVNNASFFTSAATSTGVYFPNAAEVAVTCSGTQRLQLSGSGAKITGSGGNLLIVGGTSAAPSGIVTPVAWTDAVISGTTYKIPLYQ